MKPFLFLSLAAFCATSVSGQTLSAQTGSTTPRTVQVKVQINNEGSYELQRSSTPFTNWTTLTNFNALRGSLTWEEPLTSSNRVFRGVQLTEPAAIALQPAGVTNYSGQTVRLEARASGSWPLRVQWYKDAKPVAGATSNVLTFTATRSASGNYNLLASNSWGQAISAGAMVQVVAPVATNIAGRKIRFVIKTGTGNFLNSGSFDTVFNAGFYYNTTGSSVYLNDIGSWEYWTVSELTSVIHLFNSVTYSEALFNLSFQTATNGTYTLNASAYAGSQTGTFSIVN